jgi:hypothetical protein
MFTALVITRIILNSLVRIGLSSKKVWSVENNKGENLSESNESDKK